MQKIMQSKSLLVGSVAGVLAVTTAIGAGAIGANPLHTGVRLAADGDHDRDDKGGKERHPELRRALRALENARGDLQKAAHDFAGHREKALDLTQQAIAQVHEALKSDKK